MKKLIELCVVAVILLIVAVVFAGCEESVAQNANPLSQQLVQIKDPNWIKQYGDGVESQLAYNIGILRYNQLLIANVMNKAHTTDPNTVIWVDTFVPASESIGYRPDGVVVWKTK